MIRCAIYTRKSAEAGLEQDFNSLDAQREACAAYIASQKAEGWVRLPDQYDDGGVSGGTLDRPGMERLLADVEARKVDRIVVYKIDRLTRSLTDFAKLVERLDAAGASFVSVTQSFDTGTSMGRLTPNMLLSFAQFEREVTAERIRDKIAASKKKGLWMGGLPPLGYDVRDKALVVNDAEAAIVRAIFDLYLECQSIPALKAELDRRGLRTKARIASDGQTAGGVPFTRGRLHHLLTNPIYVGKVRHGGQIYRGRHKAIIDAEIWRRTQAALIAHAQKPRGSRRKTSAPPLSGKLRGENGETLAATHANKNGRRYRYYVSRDAKHGEGWRLPAHAIERAVADAIAGHVSAATFASSVLTHVAADAIMKVRRRAQGLADALCDRNNDDRLSTLVTSIRIGHDAIDIDLDAAGVAEALDLQADHLDPAALSFSSPAQLRRRGVEKRLILEDQSRRIDRTLLRTIAQGRVWAEQMREEPVAIGAIAIREGLSRIWVMRHIEASTLSPRIIERIVAGRQPAGLTAAWLLRNPPPADWNEQERVIARL